MSNVGGGKQEQLIALMKEHGKNQFWTRQDFMDAFGWEKIPAENAVYNAWRTGKIYRHKDSDKEGNRRYALSMKEQYRDIPPPAKSASAPGQPRKKKKGALPTAKEIRKMFADHMNQTAQIEDTMLAVIDRLEELEKVVSKIEHLIP